MCRQTLTLVAATLMFACLAGADAADKPNVLFIAIDDLNDWIGCLGGHPQAKTPNIDRLAERGVLFTNAHCQAPICNPSRVSLMTGARPSTTGIYLLSPTDFRKATPLLANAAETPTIPEHFAANGYATLGCGKIYHGNSSRETFREYGPKAASGPFPKQKLNYPQGVKLWDWGRFPERDEQQGDVAVAEWAVDKLQDTHEKPFFLAVGFFRPHVPLYAPEKWWDLYGDAADIKLPPSHAVNIDEFARKLTHSGLAPRHEWMLAHQQWRRAVHAYLACVSFVDHQVGRVLDALETSPHADDTVIVLWSDHGWALGEKQRWAKRSLWERSTKVPLIVAAPGFSGNRRCAEPAGLIDIYPTLCDLCDLTKPQQLEGASLLPSLRDTDARRSPAVTTFYRGNHAVRSKRWRYIRYSNGSEELYDHRNDRTESRNLASDPLYREVIAEHVKRLPVVNVAAAPGSSGLGVRPEDQELFDGHR